VAIRIDSQKPVQWSKATDPTRAFRPRPNSLVFGERRISFSPAPPVQRQSPTAATPETEDVKKLTALNYALRQVHRALIDLPIELGRSGGIGNDYFVIKIMRNSETGVYSFKIHYSPLGKETVAKYREDRPRIPPEY
jgi:hypothetical protein